MLDEIHERLPQNPIDHNVYNLGSIKGHNVVIAGLPTTGNNSAATVVTQMRNTFRSLRFCLLVGIGGGVPTNSDSGPIRLGDVVVSNPTGEHSGAVQYDHGKAEAGLFKRTGFLQPPPRVLLNAAQDLASHRAIEDEDPISLHLKRFNTNNRGLRRYRFPGRDNDHLYQPEYIHADSTRSCEKCGCDPNRRLSRDSDEIEDDEGDEPYIVVHRGTVASGELVIKNGVLRDQLAESLDILCFEMEAAGALNDFPCLVVRGISDYPDSHKNDKWHGFAAASAAAYARQLFFHMPVDEVKNCSVALEAIKDIQIGIKDIRRHTTSLQHQDILDWLTPIDYALQQNDFLRRRQPDTGGWLLESKEFRDWVGSTRQTLFCPGIPGAGKTMMTAIAVDHLHQEFQQQSSVGVAYLYCNFKRAEEQKPADLIANLTKQLLHGKDKMPPFITKLFDIHKANRTRPSIDDLNKALLASLSLYLKTFILIDALDECEVSHNGRQQFLDAVFHAQNQTGANILVTSRNVLSIEETFKDNISLEIRASESDVRSYLQGRIGDLADFVQKSPDLQQSVQKTAASVVDGMFLLAQLHMDSLRDSLNLKMLKQTLSNLPAGKEAYPKAYDKVMERILGQSRVRKDLAMNALSWIVCAKRPLVVLEIQHALAIEVGQPAFDEDNITEIQAIVSACAGLVTTDKESGHIRLIHYTAQEYFEQSQTIWFPDCHAAISRACLTYLSYDIFGLFDVQSWKERMPVLKEFSRRYALYCYAAHHWTDDVREGLLQTDQAVITFLQKPQQVKAAAQVVYSSGLQYHMLRDSGPVHLVSWFDLPDTVVLLLDLGMSPDIQDQSARTPLVYAAIRGHIEVVRILLARGAVAYLKRSAHDSLWEASNCGHAEIVRLLIHAGADYNTSWYGTTALSAAACRGHLDVVRSLVEAGAWLEAVDGKGRTALNSAAECGHINVVIFLLEAGAQLESRDDFGMTGLIASAKEGHLNVVTFLLEAGAQTGTRGTDGMTALHSAAKRGHLNVVKYLVKAEARYDARDSPKRKALLFAAEGEHLDILKSLVGAGAHIAARDESLQTALHFAVEEGHLDIVKFLIEAGAKLDAQDRAKMTSLHLAAQKGHLEIFEFLVEAGAHIAAQDVDRCTALHYAAAQGHHDIVRCLVKAGCPIGVRDARGQTALMLVKNMLPPEHFENEWWYAGVTDRSKNVIEYLIDQDVENEGPDATEFEEVAKDTRFKPDAGSKASGSKEVEENE